MPDSSTVWTCPSCGRRVPFRVAECRCGFQQGDAPAVQPESSVDAEAAEGGRGKGLLFVGGAIVVCGVLAMIPLRSSTVTSPAGPETPAAPPLETSTAPAANESSPALVAPVVVRPGATPSAPAAADAPAAPSSLEDVVSNVVPAVVSIQAGRSRGTGFYIRPDYVLTNVHVVEGQSSVQVLAGDSKRTARVMATSPGADLAVLQVYNHDPQQPTLTLGSASGLRVGQEVIAVGSALGVLSNTVTRGIVSAVRRAGDVTLIQTDAAINPGNSGGPLVDRSGQVIGVNTLKIGRVAESIGFAVAIDHAQTLLDGQSSMAASAPVNGLNNLIRSGGPSEGEQLREQGEQEYDAVLQWASQNASQIDDYWDRYSRTCVTSARRSGDRAWFSVFEPHGVTITAHSAYNCEQFLETVRTNAARVKAEIDKVASSARQKGVYPGVMRDLRRKHRMDWSGFER